MNVTLECIPCYLTQTINTLAQTEISEEKKREIIYKILPLIPHLDPHGTPAENSTLILRKINELLKIENPFQRAKRESNELALKLLPQLKKVVSQNSNPLLMSLKISVAGNIIDMGILKNFDVEKSVQEAITMDFARNDYVSFLEELKKARKILILGDNSGEIAFDMLLAEQLLKFGPQLTYAVKGRPILNDATMEDAVFVGMPRQLHVISNGSGFLGTILKDCSEDFKQAYSTADIIISKGQANYESLEESGYDDRRLYFLLRVKCEIIAKNLGVQLGKIVFCRT